MRPVADHNPWLIRLTGVNRTYNLCVHSTRTREQDMSSFNGNFETQLYWALHGTESNALIINGWSFTGTSSDDTIVGSDYTTQYRSFSGGNFTDIQYGTDTLIGGSGIDYVDGAGANDSVAGGDGADTVTGADGDDFVHGNMGNDFVFGGNGVDTVLGGQGGDVVTGDAGNDFVSGDGGNDTLYGGSGSDTFNFATGFGADSVADFNRGDGDSVKISSGSYTIAQVGADTVVTMSDGATLTLQNVTYSLLDAGWIHA
jgi:serralysin